MPVHVAILLRPYIKLILSGRKTVESRLTITPRAPFEGIKPGDRIFFKASAGPYMATAVADAVARAAEARRPRTRYVVGRGARSILAARRILSDRAFDRFMDRTIRALARVAAVRERRAQGRSSQPRPSRVRS